MKRPKILPAHMRGKKRYISFEVISEEPVEYSDLEAAFWNVMLDFLGEYGVSKTSAWLMKDCWKQKKQVGIIRCNNKSIQPIMASLGMISRLGDNRITFKILDVSGTLKTIRKRNLN